MRLPIAFLAGALLGALPTSAFAHNPIEWQLTVDMIVNSAVSTDDVHLVWHIEEGTRSAQRVADFKGDMDFMDVMTNPHDEASADGKMLVVTIKDGADSVPLDASVFDELDDLTYHALVDALYKFVLEKVMVSSYSPRGGADGSDRDFDELDDPTYSALFDALYEGLMENVAVSSYQVNSARADRDFGDLAVYDEPQAAICIGSASCDGLLWTCETGEDCEFTCHVASPGEGRACIVGSTD